MKPGLLPHANPGLMGRKDLETLRRVQSEHGTDARKHERAA